MAASARSPFREWLSARATLLLHKAVYGRRPGSVRFLRLWKSGQIDGWAGPVHVSMNDFWIHRTADISRVARAGLRFRRKWPRTEGALGLWLAASHRGRRSISVSVWRSRDDLRAFVASPAHLKVMRQFRGAGDLHTTAWASERLDAALIWDQAEDRLLGRIPGVDHH